MKKQLIATAAVLSIGSAYAHGCLTGWYAGAQGGIHNTLSRDVRGVGGGAPFGPLDAGRTGGTIGLMAGYGKLVHKWYLAGQVEGSIGDYNHSANALGAQLYKLKANKVWGLAALLGYEVMPRTVGYVRLGVDMANWKASLPAFAVTKRSSQVGFAPGAGVRFQLAKHWLADIAYKQSFFSKVTATNGTDSVRTTPRLQTFTLGVAYKW